MQRLIAAVVATSIGLTTVATAQPGPEPAPAPAPAPAQSISGWWRFTLVDGQTVDAYVVSSDDKALVIQTPQGTYTLERSRIAASSLLPGPSTAQPAPPQPQPYAQPAYTPPPQTYVANPQAYEEARESNRKRNAMLAFGGIYGFTALMALARLEDDDDAAYGFIPVAGPIVWAATDDDRFLHDGWDWLALLASASQLLAGMSVLMGDEKPKPRTGMTMTVMSTPAGGGGLSVMGSF